MPVVAIVRTYRIVPVFCPAVVEILDVSLGYREIVKSLLRESCAVRGRRAIHCNYPVKDCITHLDWEVHRSLINLVWLLIIYMNHTQMVD